MHLEGNAAKWWQAYKQNHTVPKWKDFYVLVQDKFGANDFRTALTELLNLKQTGTVEDYTTAFQSLQFDTLCIIVIMMSCSLPLNMWRD